MSRFARPATYPSSHDVIRPSRQGHRPRGGAGSLASRRNDLFRDLDRDRIARRKRLLRRVVELAVEVLLGILGQLLVLGAGGLAEARTFGFGFLLLVHRTLLLLR